MVIIKLLKLYLRSKIKESVVGCLKFTFPWWVNISSFESLWLFSWMHHFNFLRLVKPKWVYTVRTLEKSCLRWICLYIFPSSVWPSTGNKLKIFFRKSVWHFLFLRLISETWLLRSCSYIITSTILNCYLFTIKLVLHFYILLIYNNNK